jgi:PhzF family phenazine biosynthesis protein
MKLPIFQVDAFTDRLFGGNPAAVVPLEEELPDSLLQAIAAENNLSETAFVMPGDDAFRLRWFTPVLEVDLCGHATLATAHVLFETGRASQEVHFMTASGRLTVEQSGDLLNMDFPALPPQPAATPENLGKALGADPEEVWSSRDLLTLFKTEKEVLSLQPDFTEMDRLDVFAIIATAPGEEVDFVSRFFAPRAGVPEDPVTGSAHSTLTPFWSKRLGKRVLHARQVSRRGGELFCEERGDRVTIGGKAVIYLQGEIRV